MSLRLKINLIVGGLGLLFALALIAFQLRGLRDSVHEEVVAAHRVATQLLERTAWLYTSQGAPAMQRYLQGVGRVRANDIRLLDGTGRELYRSPPSTYKAGRDAPTWFTKLISPQMQTQSIVFPDGRLETAPNATRAVLDAWDDIVRFGAGVFGALLLTLALVTWLVGRAVKPFGRIVDAINDVQAGRFDTQLPPLRGREAGTIGTAFNRMVAQLRDHIETERRAARAEAKLSDSRDLARWVDRHVEDERRLIARELHDEFGQSVTGMRSLALAIAKKEQPRDAELARTATLIAGEASRLYDAMHGIIPRLAPLVLDSFGLREALDDLAERTRAAHVGVSIDVTTALDGVTIGSDAALALYRAAQEGITNALRHGQARRIELTVRAEGDRVVLHLDDDGRGLPPADAREAGAPSREGHYGLRWLTERAEALGGSLALAAREPRGTRLAMALPR